MGSIEVTGGSDGITARCDEIRAMARHVGESAGELGCLAFRLHGYTADPGIALAGVIDPHDLLCFEGDLLDALDGPRGLTWSAAELAGIDLELRAAAQAYQLVDDLSTGVHDLVLGVARLPRAAANAGSSLLRGDPIAAAEHLLTDDPELADITVTALGAVGLISTAATVLPDGHPAVRPTGIDRAGVASSPPRNVRDLLLALEQRNEAAAGAIDVRILTGSGRRRVIVDIPGTKSANPLPAKNVTGLLTDARALTGRSTTYEAGVLNALRRTGVTREDDVMLVGHSEGGMVAITAARDAVASREFTVTHVVTVGSPIGLTAGQVPRGTKVLALEDASDVVPHLDGRANPDLPNVTTVTAHADCDGVLDCHTIPDGYEPIAGAVDASDNPSLRDFRSSAAEYFTAEHVETHTFVVTRAH